MNNALENSTSSTDNHHPSSDGRKQSPPAFLDLADSAARLGTNMPDMSARVELKRLEHERQRLLQRKIFEDQMRVLEQQQAQELLNIPYDPNSSNATGLQHLAVSAPTTPPRINAVLTNEFVPAIKTGRPQQVVDAESLLKAVGTAVSDKRKSVTLAPVDPSPEHSQGVPNGSQNFARPAGAKSMPASRRTSASGDDDDLSTHLQGLSVERANRLSPAPAPNHPSSIIGRGSVRYGEEDRKRNSTIYNAGMMLDEQLDQEMHNAMRNLPTSDDDKYHHSFANKLSASSAALDLAHLSQTSPRTSFSNRTPDPREKSSEWPQFTGSQRGPDGLLSRNDRRNVNPNLTLTPPLDNGLGGAVSASSTPLLQQHPQIVAHSHNQGSSSRRSSPSNLLESLTATTRSVPATPLGVANNAAHLAKTPGTPRSPDPQTMSARLTPQISHQHGDNPVNAGELQASLSRIPPGQYENGSLKFNTIEPGLDDSLQQYGGDVVYNLNGPVEGRYNSYVLEPNNRNKAQLNSTSGSTALYHHNGSRYGLGLPSRATGGADSKMNGLHGPKHKRGDIDREFNRFAGTRLEDLQGEIPALCKDQHGCRYLQKKLEEGVPEHRDMIFRETFGHFADLMTDPFGNYLCQKLLEYSTDEQRTLICESVAKDLVNISLNMHGTRAVQKMIDFLSTRRQADLRYNAQIRAIILALSLHVVVLIKDLNGNHVIQKCLNKLAPEDNQFIYNAVAANCVEVATHRHGCCVLQRCIDHASDLQRIQLVQEITYNALTLVQDPYGNYVVQYILDLNDNRFSDAVIRQFTGNVCALSVQKFSSNVIEKCVRVAEHNTRKVLIEELLNRTRLEKLLRDSYGNYCVQTALDYAEPTQRALLVEGIRPVLPLIRNTPYGKRIQNKLQREQMDHFANYHNQQTLMGLGHGPHGAVRHMAQGNHLGEVYNAQNGIYALQAGAAGLQGQGSFGPTHLNAAQLHGMQPQSIDGYVLQGNSNHGQGLSPSQTHPGAGFPSVSTFTNVNAFGGATLNDPYQRPSFGYGM